MIRRSPLDGVALIDGLRELPFLAQIDVRLESADVEAREAVESVIGPLPLEPNTVHGGADAAVLWLGPDEWLVVGPPDSEPALQSQLCDALGDHAGRIAIVDVSANRTTLELGGPRTRELLEFGCPIDLHPRVFGPGRCAQTLLARANVLIWHVADEPEETWRLWSPLAVRGERRTGGHVAALRPPLLRGLRGDVDRGRGRRLHRLRTSSNTSSASRENSTNVTRSTLPGSVASTSLTVSIAICAARSTG